MLFIALKRQFNPQALNRVLTRLLSVQSTNTGSSSGNVQNINHNVAGLSENCVRVPNKPVGPNAAKDKEYKNPEYFCYNVNSFAEAEVEMEKYRLPAPSNKRKFGG